MAQRDSLSRATVQKSYYRTGYEIRLPRLPNEPFGKLFDGGHKGMIASFPTRSAAEKFIKSGKLDAMIAESRENEKPACYDVDSELWQFFSDYYKDTNGFRPRDSHWTVNRVNAWLDEQVKADEEEKDRMYRYFEEHDSYAADEE